MDVDRLVSPDGSRVSRPVYFEPEIYAAERHRIFQKCWLYVAHESQLRSPGDFVASYMGEEPVIVTRSSDGAINVLVNSCSHRGTRVCRVQEGTARTFTCPYHGWQFSNDGRLLGVPYSSADQGLDKEAWGLHRAPKVEQCLGLVFATFDAEAPPLADYLGADLIWYLETIFGRCDEGVRIVGGLHRWRLNCNWKVPVENHAPDMIHVAPSHQAALSAMGTDEFRILNGYQITTDQGHLVSTRYVTADDELDERLPGHGMSSMPNAGPFLRDRQPSAEARLGAVRSRLNPMSITVFPNLSIVPTNFTIRVCHPRDPGVTEMWSWCYVPTDAGRLVEADVLVVYETMLGPAGLLEAEDGENWSAMTAGARSCRTDPRPFYIGMGLGEEHSHADLPGSFGPLWSEHNQRAFYRAWRLWINS